MRISILLGCVGTALMLLSGLQIEAAQNKETITLDLASFKFKVEDDKANLFGHNDGEGKLFFYTNGLAEATVKVPADGDFDIIVKASCDSALNERAKFKLAVDGKLVDKETLLTADDAKDYKFTTKLKAGDRKLSIEFTNDVYKENEYDRNLYVHGVTVKKAK
jgi:hypothetical protein